MWYGIGVLSLIFVVVSALVPPLFAQDDVYARDDAPVSFSWVSGWKKIPDQSVFFFKQNESAGRVDFVFFIRSQDELGSRLDLDTNALMSVPQSSRLKRIRDAILDQHEGRSADCEKVADIDVCVSWVQVYFPENLGLQATGELYGYLSRSDLEDLVIGYKNRLEERDRKKKENRKSEKKDKEVDEAFKNIKHYFGDRYPLPVQHTSLRLEKKFDYPIVASLSQGSAVSSPQILLGITDRYIFYNDLIQQKNNAEPELHQGRVGLLPLGLSITDFRILAPLLNPFLGGSGVSRLSFLAQQQFLKLRYHFDSKDIRTLTRAFAHGLKWDLHTAGRDVLGEHFIFLVVGANYGVGKVSFDPSVGVVSSLQGNLANSQVFTVSVGGGLVATTLQAIKPDDVNYPNFKFYSRAVNSGLSTTYGPALWWSGEWAKTQQIHTKKFDPDLRVMGKVGHTVGSTGGAGGNLVFGRLEAQALQRLSERLKLGIFVEVHLAQLYGSQGVKELRNSAKEIESRYGNTQVPSADSDIGVSDQVGGLTLIYLVRPSR